MLGKHFSYENLEIIFRALMDKSESNTSSFRNVFPFDELKNVNMDMDGVHFNLLKLEEDANARDNIQSNF